MAVIGDAKTAMEKSDEALNAKLEAVIKLEQDKAARDAETAKKQGDFQDAFLKILGRLADKA